MNAFNERLKGKRAVVTGGAQGIGAATARRLAAEGAIVAVLDLNAEAAKALLPAPHIGVHCNIADSQSVDSAFAEVEAALGGIDILVNNAGIGSAAGDGMDRYYATMAEREGQIAAGQTPTVFADQTIHCTDAGWATVIGVTLDGAFRCSRAAVRIMAARGQGGAIVNVASTAAIQGNGPVPYCTAKAGIMGMTRAMAVEMAARGIRVNAVHPGATDTPLFDGIPEGPKQAIADNSLLKRLGHPEEVASAIAFLASDDASYATGSIVTVNGGAFFC